MAPALFPAFLLPQVKPTRLLRLALLTGDLLPLGLLLLPLELDGLLGRVPVPAGRVAWRAWRCARLGLRRRSCPPTAGRAGLNSRARHRARRKASIS